MLKKTYRKKSHSLNSLVYTDKNLNARHYFMVSVPPENVYWNSRTADFHNKKNENEQKFCSDPYIKVFQTLQIQLQCCNIL